MEIGLLLNKRIIKNINDMKFDPFDNYGNPVEGMSWHKISYDKSSEVKIGE